MKLETFVYPYGAYYNANLPKPKSIKSSDTIIVYTDVRDVDRKISSLEGVFVPLEPIIQIGSPLRKRTEMLDFEKEYSGKFQKFS